MKFSTQIMAALSGAFFFFGTLSAADAAGCKIDFTKTINDKDGITGWVYKGKPGTDRAKFSVVTLDGAKVLKAEAVDASGSILFDISRIDFKKYPVMRWKWRADVLPAGADVSAAKMIRRSAFMSARDAGPRPVWLTAGRPIPRKKPKEMLPMAWAWFP